MKKIKFFAISIAICGASLLGYNAYSNATMTEQERLIQQNLEALTSGELIVGSTYSCEKSIKEGDTYVFYCGVCNFIPNSKPNGGNSDCTVN